MIQQIKNAVYRHIREYDELTEKDVAEATGKSRYAVRRWETGEQFPSANAEAILVEKANLTRLDFVEIMCKVLSKFLGRPVIIATEGQYVPASPLEGAAELLSTHRDKLAPEVQRRLEDSLREARKQAAETDRASIALEREIRDLIVNAPPKVVPGASPRPSGPVTGELTTVTGDATSAATSPARRLAYGLLSAYRPAAPWWWPSGLGTRDLGWPRVRAAILRRHATCESPRQESTTLDRVHAAMLLQAGGRANALRALLKAEQQRGPEFLRLANALSALYPKGTEERRLVEAMVQAVPR